MISFEEAAEMLEEIALSLPPEFYRHLNGGVNLLPDTVFHPEGSSDLYIMGHYTHDERGLGRYINIYYGSFIAVYGGVGLKRQKEELRKILTHEFTHHLESLGGERGLERKDELEMEQYRRQKRKK